MSSGAGWVIFLFDNVANKKISGSTFAGYRMNHLDNEVKVYLAFGYKVK